MRRHSVPWLSRQSVRNFDRPQYKRLMRRLRPGDVLAIKSIDRLGRNYAEILEQWRIITRGRRQSALASMGETDEMLFRPF